jgi:uncharacterized membrane protein YphA (DoxX/SURF4 family)
MEAGILSGGEITMNNILSNKYLLILSAIILGGVFVFAGIEKISGTSAFAGSIYNYKLFPEVLINLFAVIIPWIELVCGILLIFRVYPRECSFILNLLLLFFIIIVIISITRGLNIECGCFGTAAGSRVGWLKVLENSALFLLGIHLMFYSKISQETN